jgi:hypothetical protein
LLALPYKAGEAAFAFCSDAEKLRQIVTVTVVKFFPQRSVNEKNSAKESTNVDGFPLHKKYFFLDKKTK